MALTVTDDGYIVLKTKKDVKQAVTKLRDLKAERAVEYEESGLKDMDEEIIALSAAVRDFMNEQGMEQVDGDGFHATLVRANYAGHWVTTEDEIAEDDPPYVVSLKKLIEKKFKSKVTQKGSKARKVWMQVTKRVADHEAIEAAVADGTLKVDDISKAWVEKTKAPYVRLFED